MAENFDNLEIQITASATNAIKSVNSLAKALERLNTALGGINTSNLQNVSAATSNLSNSISTINTRKMKSVAQGIQQVASSGSNIAQTANATQQLANAANNTADAMNRAGQSAGGQGANSFKNYVGSVQNAGNKSKGLLSTLESMRKSFAKLAPHANKAAKSVRKVGGSSGIAGISVKKLAKELTRITKMLKLMVTRMILRKIITGVIDGFKNLAQYSARFDASISLLWNSMRQLGNSIAAAVSPLVNAFAPALNQIVQLAIKAVNAINQLISALLGFKTWTRAKTLTDSYAESLEKAGGAAKELKKTVLGFDELNQLQDNSDKGGGGGTNPADMFEEADVADKWKNLAEKLKKYWNKFIDPIKKAWAKAGQYVKDSWIKAFENVKKLINDIADDFLEVWNQPQTIAMLENIFKIVGNIGQFVGNLANSFDKAWNKADVGKRILEDIRDICAIVVDYIEQITASWAEWADEIDFSPLLESTEKWLESLQDPIDAIMGIIKDLNDDFIQPLATWLIEKGIPDLIDVFTRFNKDVKWDVIRDRLDRVWKALEPFAETVGEGLILFIGDVADALAGFLNSDGWDSFIDTLETWTQKIDAEDIARCLKLICGALLGYKALTFLSGIAADIAGLGTACASLGTLGAAAGLIAGLGASIMLLKRDIQNYKDYLGTDSLWDALFNKDDEIKAQKKAYADAKASNPYLNGTVSQDVKKAADELDAQQEWRRKKVEEKERETREKRKENLAKEYQYVVDFVDKVKEKLNGFYSDISDYLNKINGFFSKDKWTFSGVADGLRDTFSSAKNAIKGVWNSLADALNGSFTVGERTFSVNLPHIYASGGFPEDGLFMANHNELVGKFSNGRTAVANNEQITEGIARAVYSAMVSANGTGSAKYINNTIQIDGKTIARAVTVGQDKLNRLNSPTMA